MTIDENRLIRERTEGAKAEQLWDNKLIQSFFTSMEEDIRNSWKNTLHDEVDKREEIFRRMRTLEEFKHKFRTHIATGKAAATRLEKKP